MKRLWLTAALLLAGCAGAPAPDTDYYLLRSGAAAPTSTGEVARVLLGSVQVASYIDRAGIVIETDSGSLRPARYHQWAEPLRDSLRVFFAGELSASLGRPVRAAPYPDTDWRQETDTVIDLRIDILHGTQAGDALLAAHWAVVDPATRSVRSEHDFSRRQRLGSPGYPALVDAERALLRQLAAAIAESL
jgi:uncharacterized lipoprotein YmbA